jgi:hypothetical protein
MLIRFEDVTDEPLFQEIHYFAPGVSLSRDKPFPKLGDLLQQCFMRLPVLFELSVIALLHQPFFETEMLLAEIDELIQLFHGGGLDLARSHHVVQFGQQRDELSVVGIHEVDAHAQIGAPIEKCHDRISQLPARSQLNSTSPHIKDTVTKTQLLRSVFDLDQPRPS